MVWVLLSFIVQHQLILFFWFCFVFVFAFMLLPPIFLICKYTQNLLYQLNCLREITSFTISQDDLLPVIPYYGYLSWVSWLSLSAFPFYTGPSVSCLCYGTTSHVLNRCHVLPCFHSNPAKRCDYLFYK